MTMTKANVYILSQNFRILKYSRNAIQTIALVAFLRFRSFRFVVCKKLFVFIHRQNGRPFARTQELVSGI